MHQFLKFVGLLFLISCDADIAKEKMSYEPLPENFVAYDQMNEIQVQFVNPVSYYTHGILGDVIEGGGLLLEKGNVQTVYLLDSTQVFEDLVPRLIDLDGDDIPEIVCILTHVEKGASVAVFKFVDEALTLHAQSEYIGRSYRWLNIAALDDLDEDGIIELCWISTPHIGGKLNVGQIEKDKIKVIASYSGVSNHKIGSRNLELSLVTNFKMLITLYVPNNSYDMLVGFQLQDGVILPVDTIRMLIDPFVPLREQFSLVN